MTATSKLLEGQFQGGRWRGVLTASQPPELTLSLNGAPQDAPSVISAGKGQWEVSFPVDPATMSQGVQSYIVADATTGERLAVPAILTGPPVDDDIRAEIALLRAELELVKRALRRMATE